MCLSSIFRCCANRPAHSHSLGEARQDSVCSNVDSQFIHDEHSAEQPIITPFEEYLEEHSRELFDTFADKNTPSVIGPEGIENLCTSAGIPPDGAQLFILAWQLHCTELARITYDEWLMGMGKLRYGLPSRAALVNLIAYPASLHCTLWHWHFTTWKT